MKENIICNTCGTRFPAEKPLPEVCPICEDDRQYVPNGVQTWTSAAELAKNHLVEIREINENLHELKLSPEFGIGQRALQKKRHITGMAGKPKEYTAAENEIYQGNMPGGKKERH